jgi:hypothetical protein
MASHCPPKEGLFKVCSANSPHWLKIGDTLGDILWTANYDEAAKFDCESFQKMMSENAWLEGSKFWFIKIK